MTRPPPMEVAPVVLTGRLVRLEPLSLGHLDGLCEAGLGHDVFRWFLDPVDTRDRMRLWVEAALAGQAEGRELPWATVDAESGRVLGSTRFLAIDRVHHRVEIGWTWVTPGMHGTGINREAKLLQLGHAFESLGAIRVEFKTDSLNERSRGALDAIGATFEGIFRHHMIVANGRHRHSAYYSVVADEWPSVRARLQRRLPAGG